MAIQKMFLRIFFLICVLNCLSFAHQYDHDDGHAHDNNEAPSFKYSKEANQQYMPSIDSSENQENKRHSHFSGNDLHMKHHHAHSHESHSEQYRHMEDDGHSKYRSKAKGRDTLSLWLESLGSTLLISAAPFIILFFIPIDNRIEHQPKLKILLSFASGGLLGDAFLHLIPHALLSHTESHSHSHSHHSGVHVHEESDVHGHDLSVGLWVLAGIVVFLMVEKFVRIVKGEHGHCHGSKKVAKLKDTLERTGVVSPCINSDNKKDILKDKTLSEKSATEETTKEGNSDEKENTQSTKATDIKPKIDDVGDIKVAGYLNLAADFTHNFTDGLAIGASYLAGKNVGIITTVTILLHEVPHEVGDFAILIQSGCSKKKAIFLQLLTAVGALTGTLCSLLAEGIGESATNWILPFTAGGFIYIATVSVIPELLEDTKFWQSVKEVIALLVGVFMMVLIAEYE